ncbi:MAG: acyl-CoA thioesterase [Gammaproteobacteria bacterium]|nr:MAG: acyl-CoA thioesterase [Gammaproteobacteria bacterium]
MTHSDSDGPRPEGTLSLRTIARDRDTNSNGDIYGGWLVAKMDLAASSLAGRIARGRTATVSIDKMDFISPVRVGAEISCYTRLEDIGRSSIRITVETWTRDRYSDEQRKVTEATFVLVAIDEMGRIRPVPKDD